jgi:FKBP-type peptidyl-prolyl cis-trans isomerase
MLVLGLLIPGSPVLAQDDNLIGLTYWKGIPKEAITTESGLQYKVQIMGKGRKPSSRSTVAVHYRGLLLNGVPFDSSYDSDEPVEMSLRSVIKGWREGIPLMPVGSVFVFLIPPELAYGERGGDVIPPNATLIFEVELYDIK